jgi:soluble lytic murein transglycosylase-like protein
MDGVARRHKRSAAGGAHRAPGRRVFVTIAALVVLVVALLVAWSTISAWYRTWMPSGVGRLGFPLHYVQDIRSAAHRNQLDPALVAAVIFTESHFDQGVRSSSGAVGLMQVMPATAARLAEERHLSAVSPAALRDPEVNVDYGAFYLAKELRELGEGKDPARAVELAAAAYNGGEDAVRAYLTEGKPLSEETVHYKDRVVSLWRQSRAKAR